MNIVTRFFHRLTINDYVTVGIGARLLGVNIITFRQKIMNGKIPARRGSSASTYIISVRDIIAYGIRHDIPVEYDRINGISNYHNPTGFVDKIYGYGLDCGNTHPNLEHCNMKQFLTFLDIDPFQAFAIGDSYGPDYGMEFHRQLKEEVLKPVANAKPFEYQFFFIGNMYARIPTIRNWHNNLLGLVNRLTSKLVPPPPSLIEST